MKAARTKNSLKRVNGGTLFIAPTGTSAQYYSWTILKLIDCILGSFFGIAIFLLGFPGYLFPQSLGLLFFIPGQLPSSFLYLSGDVFCCTLDLVFIHDDLL